MQQLPRRRRRSRRGERRTYRIERRASAFRLPKLASDDPAALAIEQLRTGGIVLSALRRATRAAEIEWRLARLVLVMRPGYPTRIADVAWQLGITDGAASNLCDAAEERALVDKLYDDALDRRRTDVILTAAGRDLRTRCEAILRTLDRERPHIWAYGRRAYIEANGSRLDD